MMSMTPKMWAAVALLTAVISVAGWFYAKGIDAEKSSQIKTAVSTKEKQDEVRNNRPDVPAIVNSLRESRL